MRFVIGALLVLAAVVLAACGGSDEYITLRPDDVDVWPYVDGVDRAYVYCEPGDVVYVRLKSVNYAANGLAAAKHGYPFVYESGLVQPGMDGASIALKACGVM